jgi:hypothetical protein
MGEDIFEGCGVEIHLDVPDDFLKVKETLSRIGISSNKNKTLYQSCHILHKRGRYVIIHFKELFKLDGKPADITNEDLGRRNTICRLLQEWNLLKVDSPDLILDPAADVKGIKILPYHQKREWTIKTKYQIGNG